MKILTQKFAFFGFLEVEGKKMELGDMDRWVLLGASILCWGKE